MVRWEGVTHETLLQNTQRSGLQPRLVVPQSGWYVAARL